MVNTTLKVKKKTKEKLDRLKVHPRQSYDEVIDFMASGSHTIKSKEVK